MIFPLSVYNSIIACSSFQLEAQTHEKTDRRLIVWKHIGFYPVKPAFRRGNIDRCAECFHRVALMLESWIQLIAYLAGVEGMTHIAEGNCSDNALRHILQKKVEADTVSFQCLIKFFAEQIFLEFFCIEIF